MSVTARERHLAAVTTWLRPAGGCQHPACHEVHVHALDHQALDVGPAGAAVTALLGGRGVGKTTTGGQWASAQVLRRPQLDGLLVGPTHSDVRRVMLEGRNGLHTVLDRLGLVADYNTSELIVTTVYGSKIRGIASTAIERARGPEGAWLWWDEVAFAAGAHLHIDDPASPWSTVRNALRLGDRQPILLTGTPRPVRLVREVLALPELERVTAATWLNTHLPEDYRDRARGAAGTRLGQQEYEGLVIDAVVGSAWSWDLLAAVRIGDPMTDGRRLMAVDPSVVGGKGNDETGILVGVTDGTQLHVVADLSGEHTVSGASSWPELVAAGAVAHNVAEIHVETDNGGDALIRLVRAALKEIGATVRVVSAKASKRSRKDVTAAHTTSAKYARALASAARYGYLDGDGRHVGGNVQHVVGLVDLETEAATFTADSKESPGRLDALNLLITAALGAAGAAPITVLTPVGDRPSRPAGAGTRPSQAARLAAARIG